MSGCLPARLMKNKSNPSKRPAVCPYILALCCCLLPLKGRQALWPLLHLLPPLHFCIISLAALYVLPCMPCLSATARCSRYLLPAALSAPDFPLPHPTN